MTRVRFVSADGAIVHQVEGAPGERLLDVAQADGQPLEGTCEGQMACSTCHVIIAPEDVGKLPPPSEEEEDLLDLAVGATRNSRLACQIELTDAMERLTVKMPPGARDMRWR